MKAPEMIKEKMLELEAGKLKIDELKKSNDELQKSIMEQFDANCDSEFIVDDGQEKVLCAKLVETNKINFDLEKVIQKLDKQKLEIVMDKSFQITDQEKFKEFCKNHKDVVSELKQCVTLEKRIDENKLDYAFNKGIICEDDLRGTYNTKSTRSMRLTRKKR